MISESVAILIVGVLLVVIFLRSRHYGYVLASLSVLFIPTLHLLILGILRLSHGAFFGIRAGVVVAFVDLLAIVLSCVFIIVFSKQFHSPRTRTLYQIVMLAYTVLLGWAYIFNTLAPLLH